MSWKLRAGVQNKHNTITESTTGVVACGESWCSGSCGLPALVLSYQEREFKAYGEMVACGPVFQPWRVTWAGAKIPVSLGDMPPAAAIKRMWI